MVTFWTNTCDNVGGHTDMPSRIFLFRRALKKLIEWKCTSWRRRHDAVVCGNTPTFAAPCRAVVGRRTLQTHCAAVETCVILDAPQVGPYINRYAEPLKYTDGPRFQQERRLQELAIAEELLINGSSYSTREFILEGE